MSHPTDHSFVDLTLGRYEQLVTRDESGDLFTRQRAEVFALHCNLFKMLENKFLSGEMKVPGTHETGVEIHRDNIALVNPLLDELDAGGGEGVNLEVVCYGQDVLDADRTEGDSVEVHVVDDLVHGASIANIFQLHTLSLLLSELAEHGPGILKININLFMKLRRLDN